MDLSELHPLGRLGKPWGHRGELVLHLHDAPFEEVEGLAYLFAEIDGLRVPFPVARIREHPRVGAVVSFQGMEDPQAASVLVNRHVYAPPGHLPAADDREPEDAFLPEQLLGMHVLDEEHGNLGEVAGIEGAEDHPVMVVRKGDQEVLIPIVEEMITGIDQETGHLVVRTPPGLVELYRGL